MEAIDSFVLLRVREEDGEGGGRGRAEGRGRRAEKGVCWSGWDRR